MELLIVIVVIGILAAITVVAYNGVQQRAKNAAIIDAAAKSYRYLQAYIAENGTYPIISGNACITTDSGCFATAAIPANAGFETNMTKVGNLPKSIPNSGDAYNGIYLVYAVGTTWNGDPQPLRMDYALLGTNQKCGVDRVSNYVYPAYVPSTTGYTQGNLDSTGKTRCWISIPGPSS